MELSSIVKLTLGDSRNYMLPILVPISAKCTATQILIIVKLNGRKDFILRGFICDIICSSKELPKAVNGNLRTQNKFCNLTT